MRMKAVAVILCLLLARQSFGGSVIAIVNTGDFHGSDVESLNIVDGESWMGLYPTQQGFKWRKVAVRIQTVRDEMVDEDENASHTGKRVYVEANGDNPLFLLRGMDQLSGVKVAFARGPIDLENEKSETIRFNGRDYRLKLSGYPGSDRLTGKPAVLTLSSDGTDQVLFSIPDGSIEGNWQLLWAGDLDGDGKLDLYMDLSDNYNVMTKRLFLSSQAAPKQLVKEVATFSTTGC